MIARTTYPRAAIALLVACGLALAGCMLMPGKFSSVLDIRKDGRFTYSYTGEIQLLALSKLAELGAAADNTFVETPCYQEDTLDERTCTQEELAEQKRTWEEGRKASAEKRKKDAESMKAFLGGIDPSSPKAAEELTARLRKQAGWRKVDYKGDGLFDVDFAIAGKLDHDFAFPTIERFTMANAFVQLSVRADRTVRIDAPGFGPAASGGDSMRSLMQMAAIADPEKGAPAFAELDGTFTIRTDGEVLANNTDDGPQPDDTGKKLDWAVNVRSQAAPMALIRLAP